MNRPRLLATLLIFVGSIGGVLFYQIATERSPVLGLDLKGGALGDLRRPPSPPTRTTSIVVRDLMRDQLESFGIAEPDVRVEGEHIIVDLPGVSDQAQAFEALKVSGIVELRPVLQCQTTAPPTSTVPGLDAGLDRPRREGRRIDTTGTAVPDPTATDTSAAGPGGGGYRSLGSTPP